jgi:hypothetical protein
MTHHPASNHGIGRRALVVFAAVALLLVACGGDGTGDDGTEPTSETTAPAGGETTTTTPDEDPPDSGGGGGSGTGGECTITVTGDREDSWTFPQSQYTFLSDRWASEDELRETVEFLGEDAAGGTYDEIVARGEPILGWFFYNCVDPENLELGVLAYPTNATTGDDLPMGPGTYPISGGLLGADGPAGTMSASINLGDDTVFGLVEDSGEVVITHWDLERLEGTISFDAGELFTEDGETISVHVEFTVVCSASGCR